MGEPGPLWCGDNSFVASMLGWLGTIKIQSHGIYIVYPWYIPYKYLISDAQQQQALGPGQSPESQLLLPRPVWIISLSQDLNQATSLSVATQIKFDSEGQPPKHTS